MATRKKPDIEKNTKLVEHLTRKRPVLRPLFLTFINEHGISYDKLEVLYDKLQTYRQILKHVDFRLDYSYKGLMKIIEEAIQYNKSLTLVKKILTNRYIGLADKDTVRIVDRLIATYDIGYEDLKNTLKQRLFHLRMPYQLNEILSTLYENLSGSFNVEALEKRINRTKAKILYKDNAVIIVDVDNDYDTLRELGSSNWCIVNKGSFKNYVGYKNRQIIIFDTSKRASMCDAVIGVTIDPKGIMTNAHDQSNYGILNKDFIFKDKLTSFVPLEMPNKRTFRNRFINKYVFYMQKGYTETFINDYYDPNVKISKRILNKVFRNACQYSRIKVIHLLLEDVKVNPTAKFNKAINDALKREHIFMVDLLYSNSKINDSLEYEEKVNIRAFLNSRL